jgi:hypothetical protein
MLKQFRSDLPEMGAILILYLYGPTAEYFSSDMLKQYRKDLPEMGAISNSYGPAAEYC